MNRSTGKARYTAGNFVANTPRNWDNRIRCCSISLPFSSRNHRQTILYIVDLHSEWVSPVEKIYTVLLYNNTTMIENYDGRYSSDVLISSFLLRRSLNARFPRHSSNRQHSTSHQLTVTVLWKLHRTWWWIQASRSPRRESLFWTKLSRSKQPVKSWLTAQWFGTFHTYEYYSLDHQAI